MSTTDPERHATEAQLESLVRGEEVPAEVMSHVAGCPSCRSERDVLRSLRGVLDEATREVTCPDGEALIAFLDETLDDVEQAHVERHASACAACAVVLDALSEDALEARPLPGVAPATDGVGARAARCLDALRSLASLTLPVSVPITTRSATATSAAYQEAMQAYRDGRTDEARAGLEAALDAGHDTPSLRHYLGACLFAAGRVEEAVEHCRVAVTRKPKLADYRWQLAQVLLVAGEGEEALEHLRRCAKLPGTHAEQAKEQAERVAAIIDS